MPPRYFSLEAANATVRIIEPLLAEIQAIREDVLANRPDLWRAMERSAGNGGNANLSALAKEFERLDVLVHRVLGTGAEIKDLSSGLIDFRALRNGAEVYLCWRYGEAEIRYWHEVESGFAGRRSIDSF